MSNTTKKQELVDAVIEEIKHDLNMGDETALDAFLFNLPEYDLIQFLPEEQHEKYKEIR